MADTSAQDLFAVDPHIVREDVAFVSLPVLPTVEPVEASASSVGAVSSSGLPIGLGRLGNRIPAARTWFERSFANLMGCVIVLDNDSE